MTKNQDQVVKTTVRLDAAKVKSTPVVRNTPVAPKKVGLSVQSKIRAGLALFK